MTRLPEDTSIGAVPLLAAKRSRPRNREVAGDARVLAGGAVGDAEHQRQVQRVGSAGQRLVQDPVAADPLSGSRKARSPSCEACGRGVPSLLAPSRIQTVAYSRGPVCPGLREILEVVPQTQKSVRPMLRTPSSAQIARQPR